MKALAREDAIDATAPRRPRRGPKQLKFEKETSRDLVYESRVDGVKAP